MSYRTTAASSSQDMYWNLAGLFKADRDSDPFSTEKTSRSARPSPYATLPSPATSSSSSSSCDSSPSGQIKDSYRTLTETARQVIKRLEHTRRSHNRDRDRHLYTTPFAHNQVKLNDGTGTNGSWISFPHDDPYAEKVHGPGKYIAISAPMPKYIPIFMRLLFEQRIPIIVSLTDFHENGHEKATPYLPYQLKETIRKKDSYSVTCTHVHQPITLAKDWKLQQRDFALKIHGSDKVHRFTQFHLPNWKDFTAGSSEGIFNLVKRVHTEKTRTKGPILAHCSGGVGRAGVFII